MRLYYLDESVDRVRDETGCNIEEGYESVRDYFLKNFTEAERLELMIRGQIQSYDDERARDYFIR